jgi:hypothetical protein
MVPVGLGEWARGERSSCVVQVRFDEEDERDPRGRQTGMVQPQGGFIGDGESDQMAAGRRAEQGAGLVGSMRSLYQLLRQRQVRADQDVGEERWVRLGC